MVYEMLSFANPEGRFVKSATTGTVLRFEIGTVTLTCVSLRVRFAASISS